MAAALSVPIGLIQGDPIQFPFQGVTTPGILQTILDITVPGGVSRDLWRAFVSCRFDGSFYVFIDSTLVGSGRTGVSVPSADFSWLPPQTANEGQQIIVTFQSRDGSPIVPLEAFLMCADNDM